MKTLTIDIQDSFLKDFLSFVQKSQNKISVRNSTIVEEDNYFDERKKELHQIREDVKNGKEELFNIEEFEETKLYFKECLEDIENGKTELLTQNEYQNKMDSFREDLKQKYANN